MSFRGTLFGGPQASTALRAKRRGLQPAPWPGLMTWGGCCREIKGLGKPGIYRILRLFGGRVFYNFAWTGSSALLWGSSPQLRFDLVCDLLLAADARGCKLLGRVSDRQEHAFQGRVLRLVPAVQEHHGTLHDHRHDAFGDCVLIKRVVFTRRRLRRVDLFDPQRQNLDMVIHCEDQLSEG